ncbi:TPA: phenylalanine--tRNA ligase subunit beta [Candidatus Delongbacteria bacterium]|nr:MAG: phenylalanine--tRNA ligase subunit beta [Candidatus Delongbacteria bacterium GWF2_40_14]HAQ61698.1 phenylalanine--tRNA ligase subunit beta [Candidatus Delongbacteria bacterium]
MKISSKWLKQYIDHDINSSNIYSIVHRLAILGFESESVEHITRNYDKFVVGKVLECSKHPNADKLTLCKVDTGSEILPIVCGAPNVSPGQTVPVALEGAKVKDFVIKKSKIRGEESCGMICAEDELGLSENHDGIMVLDESIKIGTPLNDLFGYEDIVFELEVTANRADALGYLGFAREFAFMTGTELKIPEIKITEASETTSDHVKIEILDPSACPRYSARIIKGVTVKESPGWLKERLLAVGLRPKNNIVDITNFVMLETGHPLHSFDFKEIAGKKIIVRKAANGEKFTTLDCKEYVLNDKILMICDSEKPVAMAGVMGGLHSGVTETTQDVLIEVAYFNLADIRETVKLTNIHTDSSKRFERGIDPNDAEYVADRAAALIMELAGGTIFHGIADNYPVKIGRKVIDLRISRTDKVLGFRIPPAEIIASFEYIGLKVDQKDADTLSVTVPTFRPDITREIDLIEEAVRLYGYDKIPEITLSTINLEPNENKEENSIDFVREILKNLGLTETFSKSMVDGKFCAPFEIKPVKIEHPLNEEMNHLRNSILLSLLQTADKNIRRKNDRIAIFETGKVFAYDNSGITEHNSAGVLLTGIRRLQSWNDPESSYDFYDIKGIASAFFRALSKNTPVFKQDDLPVYFDRERSLSAYIGDKKICTFGAVSEQVLNIFEIKQDVFCMEADIEDIGAAAAVDTFGIKELSKFPKVIKDISVLLDINENASTVENYIKKTAGTIMTDISVVDTYRGEQVGNDKKSYTYRMSFQSFERTLSDKDLEKLLEKIINGLKKDLNLEIR